jgi:hypothetical protein
MNFSRRQAESLVKAFLNEGFEVEGDELIILREKTIEKSYGWVFFFRQSSMRKQVFLNS